MDISLACWSTIFAKRKWLHHHFAKRKSGSVDDEIEYNETPHVCHHGMMVITTERYEQHMMTCYHHV